MDLMRAIDDMPGPEFLLLYAGVILATLAICRVWASRQDPTRHLPTPPVPDDIDPLEIAYLRGTENAVTGTPFRADPGCWRAGRSRATEVEALRAVPCVRDG
jgi:hypothetical protein